MNQNNSSQNIKNILIQKSLAYEEKVSSTNSIFYLIQICRLTILKTSLNFIDYKETVREDLFKSLTVLNVMCFWLSILPFLGFLIRLPNQKNDSNFLVHFVNTNLPGLSGKTKEINWETFSYNFDYTDRFINSITNISFDTDVILVKDKLNNTTFETFIEVNNVPTKKSFQRFQPRNFSNLKNSTNISLDEIPLKLESLNGNSFNYQTNVDIQKNSVLNQSKLFSHSLTTENSTQKTSNQLGGLKIFQTKKIETGETEISNLKGSVFSQSELKNWNNFNNAQEKFWDYFRQVALKFEKSNQGLFDLGVLKTETTFLFPRLMTGYDYPDMKDTKVLQSYLSDKANQKLSHFTSITPPNSLLLSSKFTEFSNSLKQPVFEISSTKNDETVVYYIETDGYFNDVKVKNKATVKNSILDSIITNNSKTTKPLYFFGNLGQEDLKNYVLKLEDAITDWENQEKEKVSCDHVIINDSGKTLFSLLNPNVSNNKNSFFYTVKTNDLIDNKTNSLIPISLIDENFLNLQQSHFFTFNTRDINKNINYYPFKNFLNNLDLTQVNHSNEILNFDSPLVEYSSSLYTREVGDYWIPKLKTDTLGSKDTFHNLNQTITIESVFAISLIGFFMSLVLLLKSAYSDYAKELSSYLLDVITSGKGLPLDPSTIEWLNEELGLEEKKGGIRIFPKGFSNKRFTDIAGIKSLLPELSELVWFLRNKGRKFSVTRLTNKNILLVGPPGTGKTLLVQTLAAEANVPVIAQSTNMLSSVGNDLTPADAIRMAFEKARSLAPAILFLDELDSLGTKRDSLLVNPVDELSTASNISLSKPPAIRKFYQKDKNFNFEDFELGQIGVENQTDLVSNQVRINITNQANKKLEQERDQVAALTQLLIEIDGFQSNHEILVIGATNRPAVLDPALTRPGRFSKVISVPLPDKSKRIEIIKLYANTLGWDNDISWSYLAKSTQGFSSGDLAAMTNQSGIQAILNGTKHTLETFEHAIKILTTYPTEKIEAFDKFVTIRESYYKSAQVLLSYSFNMVNQPAFIELTKRQPNPRAFQINSNFINDPGRLRTREELENILISLLAGKAGELLILLSHYKQTYSYWESDLAKQDLFEATKTALTMIEDWYFYTDLMKNATTNKFLTIPTTLTTAEYRNNSEVLEFLNEMSFYLDQELTTQFRLPELPVSFESLFQRARWKVDVTQEISQLDPAFGEWTRFHLPDPQETERNPEWIPPEEHYSEMYTGDLDQNKNVFSVKFKQLQEIQSERLLHSILLSAFNKAFNFLDEKRETLDTISFSLLQRRILRDYEIQRYLK